MKDAKKKIGIAVSSLIGPGKKFRSARELARRAHTFDATIKPDSFARNVDRARSGQQDTQISTLEAIARAADVSVEAIVAGVSFDDQYVKSAINKPLPALSGRLPLADPNKLTEAAIDKVSPEMRSLIDQMIEIDISGDASRSLLLATIGAMLMSSRKK